MGYSTSRWAITMGVLNAIRILCRSSWVMEMAPFALMWTIRLVKLRMILLQAISTGTGNWIYALWAHRRTIPWAPSYGVTGTALFRPLWISTQARWEVPPDWRLGTSTTMGCWILPLEI